MTGVGDLFSNPQPVTEKQSTLSLSAGRCGAAAPQKGSAETAGFGRRGRPSPQKPCLIRCLAIKLMGDLPMTTIIVADDIVSGWVALVICFDFKTGFCA